MGAPGYNFAGYVTRNDLRCTDGVTIKQDAFKVSDKTKVPLVWAHDSSTVENILGHMELENRDDGVYGYGYFNSGDQGQYARDLVSHGDIEALSIGANRIKKDGDNVVGGKIYEVSLVLAGANPGALIEQVINHGDESDGESFVIFTQTLVHSAEDEGEDDKMAEKTIGDVLETLDEDQMEAVQALIAAMLEDTDGDDDGEGIQQNDEGGETMKHNAFMTADALTGDALIAHKNSGAVLQGIAAGAQTQTGTLKGLALQHGISNIELLFPEAKVVGEDPYILKQRNTNGALIVAGAHKSPFSKVKTMFADLTEDEARARGYIKGEEKIEQIFSLLTRETGPQTIYKKQAIDRDDLIDITDYNIIAFIQREMREMLIEELGRAILVGDGRAVNDKSKVKEANIRPIISDDKFYTLQKTAKDASVYLETVIKAMADYEGSGAPTLFMSATLLADIKLLKGTDGRFLFGDIPSTEAVASRLGVSSIVTTTFLTDKSVIVNLNDYTIGTNAGGEVTNFDDFDIDFNKYKYLIETRLSGALTVPKSAIVITVGTPVAG